MPITTTASATTAPTQLLQTSSETYAYRRVGDGPPLLCLQHFTGTLDNWDPAVIDPLGAEKAYPKLIYYSRADKGGHFAAWDSRSFS